MLSPRDAQLPLCKAWRGQVGMRRLPTKHMDLGVPKYEIGSKQKPGLLSFLPDPRAGKLL
jgi:hypothetical protein